ncbi:MAG: primase-helicase family protein [Rhabdochlamydiaceae bacterium]
MDKSIVSENKISSDAKISEEKSKKRAAELKASTAQAKKTKSASDESEKNHILSAQEQGAIEASIVDELNRTLAIVHTSSTYILIEKDEIEFVLDSKTSLLILYENQVVPELCSNNFKKLTTKAHIWLRSPHRRTYKNIVFNPKIPGHYDGNFNIWKGFAVKPVKGDCSLFWDHVKVIICGRNEVHYIYVRKWLAHLTQKPWIIATALVLRGKQGTGKGTFVEAIGKLLGPHYAPLSSLDQILGRFNSHLKNAILIFADEAIWGGNKREVGALKSLITEPRLFIEAKGKDGYWIDNFKHLIVSSNEDWAVHLDPDDRRFFVLDISADRKEDFDYFGKIREQLENGGYEALMHDLLHEDLTGFDPKVMPENYAGFDMKLESASSIDRFIHTSLKEGCWDHGCTGPSESLKDLTIEKFYEFYRAWCDWEKQPVLKREVVGKRLRAILPGIKTKRTPREENPRRPTMYLFSSLEECRISFEKFYKQSPEIWEWS